MKTTFRIGGFLGVMVGGGAAASNYDRISGGILLVIGLLLFVILDSRMKE